MRPLSLLALPPLLLAAACRAPAAGTAASSRADSVSVALDRRRVALHADTSAIFLGHEVELSDLAVEYAAHPGIRPSPGQSVPVRLTAASARIVLTASATGASLTAAAVHERLDSASRSAATASAASHPAPPSRVPWTLAALLALSAAVIIIRAFRRSV